MKATHVLLQTLQEAGVETVFGLPGGANLPLYDALPGSGLRHVLCRHEQGAGHAAEGYAKASGRVGVAFVTSGPGATNLVTPMADAMLDSVPCVFVVGQVRTDLLGTDGFQEADAYGITMPIVKHSFLVHEAGELQLALRQAFHLAASGRPGPVMLEIPQDVLRQEVRPTPPGDLQLPGYQPVELGNGRQLKRAAELIAASQRPVLYTGGGALDAAEQVRALAAAAGLPVTSTVMGLGTYPADGDGWLGMPGMHGTRTANYALDQADLLICVGARFDDRVTGKLSEFSPCSQVIHLDVDPAEIGKNVPAQVPIVGDARVSLAALVGYVRAGGPPPERAAWWAQLRAWQQEHPLRYDRAPGTIKPQQAIQALAAATAGQAVVASDVGQHQMWCAQYYPFTRPRQWINSGGLGTMGFGIPAGLGAQLALPDRQVVAVVGDGGGIMTVAELATLAEQQIPLKVLVLNNGGYGMVRQWQELFYAENYSAVQLGQTVDWPALAQALGVAGARVSDPPALAAAVRDWLAVDGPALLEVQVDPGENCYPMIPAGAAARDMIG